MTMYDPTPQLMDPTFRDAMDARRSGWRRTPDAEWPDGYLGNLASRHDDKMLKALQQKLNRKVYDRGVHKGEKIDRGDYFWGEDFDPFRGLQHIAAGVRQVPQMTFTERILVNDGKSLPHPGASMVLMDPVRRDRLSRMAPPWR